MSSFGASAFRSTGLTSRFGSERFFGGGGGGGGGGADARSTKVMVTAGSGTGDTRSWSRKSTANTATACSPKDPPRSQGTHFRFRLFSTMESNMASHPTQAHLGLASALVGAFPADEGAAPSLSLRAPRIFPASERSW
jgi:hypothetical protein